jgi:hypothetical protein
MSAIRSVCFRIRESIRLNPAVGSALYLAQSAVYSNCGDFRSWIEEAASQPGRAEGVALCCRIRDEARYLREFVEYYLAAGVSHFFFYEKLSRDDFRSVLEPYIGRGVVTLREDWPHVPVSPSAEQNCALNCTGRFEWIGFIDADEFVVIRDGRSIGEFLAGFPDDPAVALHWYMYGSNGHRSRPAEPVIAAYTRREPGPNRHVKCFVRPERLARYRNSHSWYYRGMASAVNEAGRKVRGSFALPATASEAWINHYHHKSDQDYFEKAARKSVLDKVGMTFENRNGARHQEGESKANAVFDDCALRYYLARCQALSKDPAMAAEMEPAGCLR